MANILNPALAGKYQTNRTVPVVILPASLGSKKYDLRHINEEQAEALVKAGWDGLTKVTVEAASPKSPSQIPIPAKEEAKPSDKNSKSPKPGEDKEAKSDK
jgi:predicted dienelactone hydrolase